MWRRREFWTTFRPECIKISSTKSRPRFRASFEALPLDAVEAYAELLQKNTLRTVMDAIVAGGDTLKVVPAMTAVAMALDGSEGAM